MLFPSLPHLRNSDGDSPGRASLPDSGRGEYQMARQNRNKVGIERKTDEQIMAMGNTGVSDTSTDQTVAERSGSDDKVQAAAAENAPAKVKTVTPEGADWLNSDPHGLKVAGLYGKRDSFALRYEDLERHAQFRGTPMGPADLEVIHSTDNTAPKDGVTCPICSKPVTSFVRTALIDRETGDLMRNKEDGNIVYRGQFVAVGPDATNLTVHGAHPGECLFRLRIKRDRNGDAVYESYTDARGAQRSKVSMLPCQSFAQATARAEGVKASILAKRNERTAEENRMKTALGFKVGDVARHTGGNRTDDGIDRGSFAPKIPRGQTRKQPRRWASEDAE